MILLLLLLEVIKNFSRAAFFGQINTVPSTRTDFTVQRDLNNKISTSCTSFCDCNTLESLQLLVKSFLKKKKTLTRERIKAWKSFSLSFMHYITREGKVNVPFYGRISTMMLLIIICNDF